MTVRPKSWWAWRWTPSGSAPADEPMPIAPTAAPSTASRATAMAMVRDRLIGLTSFGFVLRLAGVCGGRALAAGANEEAGAEAERGQGQQRQGEEGTLGSGRIVARRSGDEDSRGK